MKEPHYPLERVRRLARDVPGKAQIGRRLALDIVAERLNMTGKQAKQFILDTVEGLTNADFAETLTNFAPPADVYGCYRERCGWYVKLAVNEPDVLHVISHHPPERALRTNSGTITAV